MGYVQFFVKAVYRPRLSELPTLLVTKNSPPVMQDACSQRNQSNKLVVLRCSFDNLWFCLAHEHWQKPVDFAIGNREPPRGNGSSHTNAGSWLSGRFFPAFCL